MWKCTSVSVCVLALLVAAWLHRYQIEEEIPSDMLRFEQVKNGAPDIAFYESVTEHSYKFSLIGRIRRVYIPQNTFDAKQVSHGEKLTETDCLR